MYREKWAIIWGLVTMATLGWGVVYGVGQQGLRRGANWPQWQMVQAIKKELERGNKPTEIETLKKVRIENDLEPYIIIVDKQDEVVANTGWLDGEKPKIPQGVLINATIKGINVVTWQPRKGVRSAIVVAPYSNGWVVAGRSLTEVEKQEDSWLKIVAGLWLVSVVVGKILILSVNTETKKRE